MGQQFFSRTRNCQWAQFFGCLGLLGSLVFGAAGPGLAAEKFSIPYSGMRFNLTIKDLEVYAAEGKLQGELASYAKHATPEQMAQLREVLNTRINVPPFAVSQFLYSHFGETLLQSVGEDLRTRANQNGFYGLRSAFILAANDPQGLNLLNILRLVPGCCININTERVLGQFRIFSQVMESTTQAMQGLHARAEAEIKAIGPIDFSQLPDLRQPGPYQWTTETITVTDGQRQRQFQTTVYVPQTPIPAPVVLISHGLGSDGNDFAELGKHLASYGIAVALPSHPGSDAQQRLAFLQGYERQVIRPEEFLERPRDMTVLLDELTHLTKTDARFQGRLNPNQAGAIGHSIGGQTVLSLAGAEINWSQIQEDCQGELIALSISQPIQCSAFLLKPDSRSLRDPRIKGVIALNPTLRTVLGPKNLAQIEIPVMLVGGTDDLVTPVILEQVEPFTWITASPKYLAILEKGTHLYNPEAGSRGAVPFPPSFYGPDPTLSRQYLNALSVAFTQTHIANQAPFRAFLTPTYAQTISKPQMPLVFVQGFDVPPPR